MTRRIVSTLIAVLYLCVSCPGYSWVVTLGWDANLETDLAGYRLYQTSTQGVYDYEFPSYPDIAETETTTTAIVPDGQTCWTLTAFDLANNESGPSNEVCVMLPQDDIYPPGQPSGLNILDIQ